MCSTVSVWEEIYTFIITRDLAFVLFVLMSRKLKICGMHCILMMETYFIIKPGPLVPTVCIVKSSLPLCKVVNWLVCIVKNPAYLCVGLPHE